MWSPKFARNGAKQSSYENMKEIEPGDLILAYSDKSVGHYGFATMRALSAPKPEEFGKSGLSWSNDGWCVYVKWTRIDPIDRDVIGRVARDIFDEFEIPFDVNRSVKQSYLFKVSKRAADFVLGLVKISHSEMEYQSISLEPEFFVAENVIDGYVENAIVQNTEIDTTTKESVIQARRGQGQFRDNLIQIEKACRLTHVDDHRLLVASHIKPWRSCETNFERLDGNNGLLLTPTMDRLFDRRYLTFENNGDVVLSERILPETYERVGLIVDKKINVGAFKEEQARYLQFHRDIFLG